MIPVAWAIAGMLASLLVGFILCAGIRIQELDERIYPHVGTRN